MCGSGVTGKAGVMGGGAKRAGARTQNYETRASRKTHAKAQKSKVHSLQQTNTAFQAETKEGREEEKKEKKREAAAVTEAIIQ